MTTRRRIDRVALRDELRKKYPGGPREALRKLGLDESLLDVPRLALDGAIPMPNRLQYLAIMRTAAAINPILASDAKVDYAPLFKGITVKTLPGRKKQIVADAKKLLKGKTIAKDAPMEHFAHLLNALEHVPNEANLDESVSEPQHKAMEAAAHGQSNLGIPKDVGKEFAEADKGRSFDEMLMDWAKDKGMSEDDVEALKKMHADSMPENALDEREEDEEAEDEHEDEEEAEDEEVEEEDKPKHGKDAKRGGGAHDARPKPKNKTKTFVTIDEMRSAVDIAVKAERKNNQAVAEARAFVRPYVGDVSMALDSAQKIYLAAAEAMNLADDDDPKALQSLSAPALRMLIKRCGHMAEDGAEDSRPIAQDDDGDGEASGFDRRWGGIANRIGHA